MALHNETGAFDSLYGPGWHGLGSGLDAFTAFTPIVNGIITSPM